MNNKNILKTNTISFFNFFKYLDDNALTLVIPPIQRPAAWDSKKIKSILDSNRADYFGPITIFEEGSQYILLDGQQRITNFLLMYKFSQDIESTNIIKNVNLGDEYIHAIRLIYGFGKTGDFIRENIKSPDIKEKLRLLENVGYKGKIKEILTKTKPELLEVLKNTFISINTINASAGISNKYDVFIDLNNSATPLSPSDIIKTIFLKNYKEKDAPIEIDGIWQKVLLDVNRAKKLSMDKVINQFLKLNGKSISSKKMPSHYEQLIKNLESKNAKSDFVAKQVGQIEVFSRHYVIPQSYSEKVDSFPAGFKETKNGLFAFAYESGIYKPFNPLLIEFSKKCGKALSIPKAFHRIIYVLYLVEFNKRLDAHPKEGYSFMRPAKTRQFMEKQKDISNLQKFTVDFLGKEPIFDSNVAHNVIDRMIKSLGNVRYGKTMKLIFDFCLDNYEAEDVVKFKALLSTEHFFQDIKNSNGKSVQEKKTNNNFVFLIEPSLHKKMNEYLKSLNHADTKPGLIKKYNDSKVEFYKKSSVKSTKFIGDNFKGKQLKNVAKEYYSNAALVYIKSIVR